MSVKLLLCLFGLTLAGTFSAQAQQDDTSSQALVGNVTLERLMNADQEPENWLTTGRDVGKSHFSPLDSINTDNVQDLGFAWHYDTGSNRGLEATPIVVDGVMFTSGPLGRVYALNAATGEEIWAFTPDVDMQANRFACCDQVNRGVAVWEGHVYVAALDGQLFKLNAANGNVVWKADTIDDHSRGYASTGAPAIAGDVVVIGNSGAEWDARGYISAYDLETGKMAWRFYTVPGDPGKGFEHPELEMAAKTWDPDSLWNIGGGTVWDAMVYDPILNLLYVGTGNGAPHSHYKRSPAGGDNLFLASILAINPDTGRLVWHYQQVPGDSWDYTATQPMILADIEWQGETRPVIMQAPKNGFFYVIDRRDGTVLSADPYVPVTWAKGVDLETGRAIVNHDIANYSDDVKLFFPSGQGGHNWNPMSYHPGTGLVYIPAIEVGEYAYDLKEPLNHTPRTRSTFSSVRAFSGALEPMLPQFPEAVQEKLKSGVLLEGQPDPTMRAFLRAWDPKAGKTVWEVESAGGEWDRAGVLSTAGNLVFQGTGTGRFRVFNATTGELLKDIDVGTTIMAAPMTYSIDGVQYVAVMAAWGGGSWHYYRENSAAAIYGNAGRIVAFRLDGGETPKPEPLEPLPPIPEPPPLTADASTIDRGEDLYRLHCSACHGNTVRTGSANLHRTAPVIHELLFHDIVLKGQRLPLGMPRFDDVLTREDVDAIQAYVISGAWKAYRRQENAAEQPEVQPTLQH